MTVIIGGKLSDVVYQPMTAEPVFAFTFGGSDMIIDSYLSTDDFYFTGRGNDGVRLHSGDDRVYTGRGDDFVAVDYGAGDVFIDGGRGYDTVILHVGMSEPEMRNVECVEWV